MTVTKRRLFGPLTLGGHFVIVIATLQIESRGGAHHAWGWGSIAPDAIVVIGAEHGHRCIAASGDSIPMEDVIAELPALADLLSANGRGRV